MNPSYCRRQILATVGAILLLIPVQSIPKKELQGFYPERLPIALPSHFGWLTEYLSWTDRNLVTLFLELTVLCEGHEIGGQVLMVVVFFME